MMPVVLLCLFLLPGWLYLIATALAVRRFSRQAKDRSRSTAPVSVLKPLAGAAPGLYEDLSSVAEQDYPHYEILLGVRDPGDEALAVARALRRNFPDRKIVLVAGGKVCAGNVSAGSVSAGSVSAGNVSAENVSAGNLKVANLEEMLPAATGDRLVLADSDIGVGPSYLAAITAPLSDPRVGAVTCLYRGVPVGGFWSHLAALHINFWFLPSAVLAASRGIGRGCFGATIAMRREVLERVGGFSPLRDELADDYRLGELVRGLGLSVVLSSTLVDHRVSDRDLLHLWRHELRWARTIRAVAPWGHLASFFTHPLALALLFAAALRFDLTACAFLGISCALRWGTAGTVARSLGLKRRSLWLIPLRDSLSFAVFLASFFGRTVFWRDRRFRLSARGRMTIERDKAL